MIGNKHRFGKCLACLVLLAVIGLPASARTGDGAMDLLVPLGGALSALAAEDWPSLRSELLVFDRLLADRAAKLDPATAARLTEGRTVLGAALGVPDSMPADRQGVATALADLLKATEKAAAQLPASQDKGSSQAASDQIKSLLGIMDSLKKAIELDDSALARQAYQSFTAAWGQSEGLVRAAKPEAYGESELLIARIRTAVNAEPPRLSAAAMDLDRIRALVAPLATRQAFGVWDAAFLILREGLEALLVLVALLAFLRKNNQASHQVWVWSGAAAGLAASVLLAITLGSIFTALLADGDSTVPREALEGFIGLAAVAMMVGVGLWLHRKASVKKWNATIKSRMGKAVAGGNFLGLAVVAFLAILREGVETLLFLAGLAVSMPMAEIVAGVGAGLLVLAAIGLLMVRFSLKLPIHAFFLTATLLIDYLCVKILGESISALQAAGVLAVHEAAALPRLDLLGLAPNWESFLAQATMLIALLTAVVVTEAANRREKKSMAASKERGEVVGKPVEGRSAKPVH